MEIYLYLIIAIPVLLAILLLALWYNKVRKAAARAAGKLFESIDEKANRFFQESLHSSLQDTNTDADTHMEKAWVLIRPEVNALVVMINESPLRGVRIKYDSPYFKDAIAQANELWKRRKRDGLRTQRVEIADVQQFFQSFKVELSTQLSFKMGKV